MEFGNQDLLWSMDGMDWSAQQQQQLEPVQEHVPNHFGSFPAQQTRLPHFSPSSYNPHAPTPSPISSASMSSGHQGSSGYSSSSFGSIPDPSQMNFSYVRPTTNVPTRSLLTSQLEQHQDITVNTIMSPNHLVSSPVLTHSPHLTGSLNQTGQFRPIHAGYGSLPNQGMRFDRDAQLSKLLDDLAMSPANDALSLSPDWLSGNHSGSLGSPHMSMSTSSGRHARQHSVGSSGIRSPYSRTLPPFTPMTEAPPVISTSIGAGSFSDSQSMGSAAGFNHDQIAAAQRIVDFIQANPTTAIPAALITSELVEIHEGRGWCLIGNCGRERAVQKANPGYDSSKDTTTRKRVDHLYDHIRDKHFDCRPFKCGQCARAFSRDHDLKRHESVHAPSSYCCPFCPRTYTREDNLKRHVGQRHPGMSTAIRHSVL